MRLLGERGPCERRFALRGLALQLALRLLRCRAASQRGGTQVREGLARVRPWARMQGRARLCCRGRSRRRPGAQTDALRRSWQICVQFPRVLVHEANRGLERAGYGAEAAGRFLVRLHAVARPPPDQAGQLPAPLFSSVSVPGKAEDGSLRSVSRFPQPHSRAARAWRGRRTAARVGPAGRACSRSFGKHLRR